ncbi:MAG: CoF synthetase [Gemmatimonadaceae bacterium]
MNKVVDPVLGRVLSEAGRVALSSWGTYRMLFLPMFDASKRDWISRKRASAAFYNARRRVPAYAEFLREMGADDPDSWDDVPFMDKTNYVKRWSIEARCQGGRLPTRGAVLDESSGSSGTASNWVRGATERDAGRRLIQYSTRSTFGDESFILINAFALGPWATGMNVSMSLVDRCVLKSTGPDVGKIVATLELLGPKYKYVVAGYPPFLKTLVDTATIDWSEFHVSAVVGGEGMSESLRTALNRCFRTTVSSFGASDLEINIGFETPFAVALRQAAEQNQSLANDLYGHEALPMIFQFDPLNYLIESDVDRNLLFTINRLQNVSPRIRYNLHDRGIVRRTSDVLAILRDHDIKLSPNAPRIDLPLLLHWGRQDSAVGFYGCKITPEDLQHVLMRRPELGGQVANFALHPYEDSAANKRLELWIELVEGASVPENMDGSAPSWDAQVWPELSAVNQDFRESIRMVPREFHPSVKLFTFGASPISGQDARIKKQYIV